MADPDVFVHVVDFKTTAADEMVRENEDGTFTILLNARSAPNRQKKAYEHAMEHIRQGDLDQKELDVNQIEMIRHGIETAPEKPMPAADWERYIRRLERARRARSRLTARNIEDYVAIRLETSDLLAEAEERWLEE